jgi:hypothetical protein
MLAVDDDPSVRGMIADYLTDNDTRVTSLASGPRNRRCVGPRDDRWVTPIATSSHWSAGTRCASEGWKPRMLQ